MNKEYTLTQFNQFRPMIEKSVWEYSRRYKLDHSELEGQAFLIFCEALKTFDKTKACFSTYLFNELNRLDGYCCKQIGKCHISNKGPIYKRYKYVLSNEEITRDTVFCNYEIFSRVLNRLDYEKSLSEDAQEIVNFILSREWENVEINWKPRLPYIKKIYRDKGWTQNRIVTSWNEIREWWKSSNHDQFCLEELAI